MKFFRKYALVLPPAALLYGIFVWNMKYPGDELVQIMDNLINGWLLITVLFAALSQELYISCSKIRNSNIFTAFHGQRKTFTKRVLQNCIYHFCSQRSSMEFSLQ